MRAKIHCLGIFDQITRFGYFLARIKKKTIVMFEISTPELV